MLFVYHIYMCLRFFFKSLVFSPVILVKWFWVIVLTLQLHLICKYVSCHVSKYKVSKFLIKTVCLSRKKWHWSWGIIETKSRGKIRKLQKKDSHEKPSWRKSCRTVSVKLCISAAFAFLQCGMFSGTWSHKIDKESTEL